MEQCPHRFPRDCVVRANAIEHCPVGNECRSPRGCSRRLFRATHTRRRLRTRLRGRRVWWRTTSGCPYHGRPALREHLSGAPLRAEFWVALASVKRPSQNYSGFGFHKPRVSSRQQPSAAALQRGRVDVDGTPRRFSGRLRLIALAAFLELLPAAARAWLVATDLGGRQHRGGLLRL